MQCFALIFVWPIDLVKHQAACAWSPVYKQQVLEAVVSDFNVSPAWRLDKNKITDVAIMEFVSCQISIYIYIYYNSFFSGK